ncbi:Hypothetical predicted protein [Mytilus galloprovincialis]|uniref:WSC domain-containing protein n=1 Tax=Mytilus galloprovincialis TaxID=29158 RepID=A0A8B6GE25_MYTGA|nr:Hypothetical predicted protein [Mytilus galloprovincialis]
MSKSFGACPYLSQGNGLLMSITFYQRRHYCKSENLFIACNGCQEIYSATGQFTIAILLTGKQYMGCYVDQHPRTLPYGKLNDNTMTNDKCVSHCCSILDDATYMGTQAYIQCFCTNVTNTDNFALSPPTECNMDCGGNPGETCGGSYRLSVYKIECVTDTTVDTYSPSSSYIPSVTTDITTESTTDVLTSTVADRCSECSCANCLQINSTVWTTEELAEKLTLLKNAISINKKETKSYKATKISAYDPRKSSRNIGIVGIALLIVPVIFVIVMDIQRIFK